MKRVGCAIILAMLLVTNTGLADAQGFECLGAGGTPPPDSPEGTQGVQAVLGKLMFVHAPGRPDHYPPWTSELISQLNAYLLFVSRGQYQLSLSPLYRAGSNVSKTWELPSTSGNYGEKNEAIMELAVAENSAVWNGVHKVFMIYENGSCPFPPCPSGRGDLGFAIGAVPGFTGNGCTVGLAAGELDEATLNWRLLGGIAHEFGHTLRFDDYMGAGTCGSPPTDPQGNAGRYDLMRSPGDGLPADNGVPSYHPRDLPWVPEVSIKASSGDQTLRIPNLRDPLRAQKFVVGEGSQTFTLVNIDPQAVGFWDELYGGDGLLIWHNWIGGPFGTILDLESAAGKFTAGVPDPVAGKDPLEADWCHRGDGRDFFGRRPLPGETEGDVPRNFTGNTNPNTNCYSTSYLAQPECSDVEFRNIHRDTNGDMLVDVSFLRQPLTSPNGGQYFVRGQGIPVTWTVTPTRAACVQDVAIQLRRTISSIELITVLAQGLPNTGSTTVTVPTDQTFATNYVVQVVTNLGACKPTDGSDSDLTIWGVDEPTFIAVVSYSCNSPTITFDVSWQTPIVTDGADVLEVFPPNQGTPFTQSAPSQGTLHRVVWQGDCQANATVPWTFRVKSAKGSSTSVSGLKTKLVTQCASCPPPCHPPCELE